MLPDGQILVHNLTQPFAELLSELNPGCEQITSRIAPRPPPPPARPVKSAPESVWIEEDGHFGTR